MIRERLERYRYIREEMEQIRQRLSDLETAMYYPKPQRLSDMPSAPSKGNAMEDMTIKHIQLQNLYKSKLEELSAEQLFIEETIATLEPVPRLFMRYKYIAGLTHEEISDATGISLRHLTRIHADAMATLEHSDPIKKATRT